MKREAELGSHSELDCLLLPVSTAGFSDSVFETLFQTAVERASCGVPKVLCARGVSTSLEKNILMHPIGSLRREYDFLSPFYFVYYYFSPVRFILFKVFQI